MSLWNKAFGASDNTSDAASYGQAHDQQAAYNDALRQQMSAMSATQVAYDNNTGAGVGLLGGLTSGSISTAKTYSGQYANTIEVMLLDTQLCGTVYIPAHTGANKQELHANLLDLFSIVEQWEHALSPEELAAVSAIRTRIQTMGVMYVVDKPLRK